MDAAKIDRYSIPRVSALTSITTAERRERSARRLGLLLVWFFGLTILWMLIALPMMVFKLFKGNVSDHPALADAVKEGFVPLLKECASTISTIFGPVPGFVLGYYCKLESANHS